MRIAINGFGRIGRIFTRMNWNNPDLEIVAVNTRSAKDIYAHLLTYDSVYGIWDKAVSYNDDGLVIDGKLLPMHHENELERAPWQGYDVDLVIESTGVFRDRDSSEKHLDAGAQRVLITAPAKDEDITMVYGINHERFDPEAHKIISSASCTTTCLASVAKVLEESFGIVHGTVVTTHAYTNDQHLVDHPHKKKSFRRARAAGQSIIPTATGAAKAIGKVLPELNGKLGGNALRIPVPVPSIISFIAELNQDVTAEQVNAAFRQAADGSDSLAVVDVGLVSVDFIRSPYGATVDLLSTIVTDKRQVCVQAWYDNEWGYVQQMTHLIRHIGKSA